MLLFYIALAILGISFLITAFIAVTMRKQIISPIVDWYMKNWILIVISTAVFILIIISLLWSLSPIKWFGNYSEVGVSLIDKISVVLASVLAAIAIPGLFLDRLWESNGNSFHIN